MTSTTLQRRPLRRTLSWATIVVATAWIVSVAAQTQQPVGASDDSSPHRCSVRTLRGSYGLVASGSRVVPFGPNAGKVESVVGTGLRIYDGIGGFIERAADLHGQLTGVTPDPGGIYGTYTVDADCTGVSTRWVPGLPFPIVSNFVIVRSAGSVKEAVMEPAPNVITVLLDRR